MAVYSVVRGVRIPFKLNNKVFMPTSPVNIFSERAARANGMRFVFIEDNDFDYIAGYAPNGDKITNARS